MAITFDASTKRIILDSAAVTAQECYSRWCDWVVLSDNAKYLPAFRATGGDDLGGGLLIPPYYFLLNGWRVRPMESSHNLTITGNLFVDGGGTPVVPTLGTYQVNVNYTVPVQAQAFDPGGGGAATPSQIADAVWGHATAITLSSRVEIASKVLRNKSVTDPDSGEFVLYDDDGTTELFRVQLWEDAGASQAYRGQGAERRERLE